jgi:ATP-binding protein involved in chromosome partitioning
MVDARSAGASVTDVVFGESPRPWVWIVARPGLRTIAVVPSLETPSPELPRPDEAAIHAALATVNDPEIRKPITELDMVESVSIADGGQVTVRVLLTVAGCPMKAELTRSVTAAVAQVDGVTGVSVDLGVMTDAQRTELRVKLRGDAPANEIPFAQPGSRTRVYAVASGKGGVGKSSVTVNVAAALAAKGLSVGVLDADIYGFSVPRMLGVTGKPTQVEQMIMPPVSHDVKVISIGMFTPGNTAVVWRGPMLHRALQQFLADVFWGELDVLLMDLPPGTGDIAISVAQLVPSAELLVVTTPQLAAREVAERAGSIALQTHQQIVGVVENMSWMDLPDGSRMELFGAGGGQAVADSLAALTGTKVPLLAQVPIDQRVREGGDDGVPIVLSDPDSPAALAYRAVADALAARQTSLVGRSLGLSPARG